MNTNILSLAGQLSDQDLVAQVKLLTHREQEATAALIAHLAILEERDLFLAEGCSSMFSYCVQVLHLSEYAAYSRIEAARAARKYPVILDRLADGSVNLTAVGLLVPDLTADNYLDLIEAAKHKSKRQVQELVARLRPQPPVPSSVRRLPAPSRTSVSVATSDNALRLDSGDDLVSLPPQSPATTLPATPVAARPGIVTPLAPERYKVQFTASAEMYAKLRLAQDLLRHQVPDGDIEQVIDRALTALLKDLTRQKFAATDRPRGGAKERMHRSNECEGGGMVPNSRHIPAEVRRRVWSRDGGRCAFIAHSGQRCTERAFLEFHHVLPYGVGGEATFENIQLRCRAHNGYEADVYFGNRKMPSTGSGPSSVRRHTNEQIELGCRSP